MQKRAKASKFFALLQGSVFHNVWMRLYASIVSTAFDINDTMGRDPNRIEIAKMRDTILELIY